MFLSEPEVVNIICVNDKSSVMVVNSDELINLRNRTGKLG